MINKAFKALLFLISLSCFANAKILPVDKFAGVKAQVLSAKPAPLLPRSDFLRLSPLQEVLLSPDGKYLVYVLKEKQYLQLWRYEVATEEHMRLINLKELGRLDWAPDSLHLYYTSSGSLYYLNAKKANSAVRIYDLDEPNLEFFRGDREVAGVFWLHRYLPREKTFNLVRATVAGEETTEMQLQGPLIDVWTHNAAPVLISQLYQGHRQISYLKDGVFVPLIRCEVVAPCQIHHWDQEKQSLLLAAWGEQDVQSLFRVDAHSGERELLHQEPGGQFDLSRIAVTESGEPLMVGYFTEFVQHYGLTSSARQVQSKVEALLGHQAVNYTVAVGERVWLVKDINPTRSVVHYSIYLAEQDQWLSPFEHIEPYEIASEHIAPKKAFWYQASDGKKLLAYLTLPLGKDPSKVPLVVSPHGGPWSRTSGGFSHYGQFMANRGYAVLEPNFRGSEGLGRNYMLSAQKDFGNGRVQQDIMDALDYVLGMGIGDADNLAIAGHSFGGFSAIAALAFTPERFKVGFAGAAPDDLGSSVLAQLKQSSPLKAHRSEARHKVLLVDVHNSQDVMRLYQQSPGRHWQKIKRPLYFWAGAQDPKVAIEGIKALALRLKSAEQQVALLSDPNEGHSPKKILAKEAYLYLLETALAKHLRGAMEKPVSPVLSRYLQKYMTMGELPTQLADGL